MDILYRCLEYPKYVPPGIFRSEWVHQLNMAATHPRWPLKCEFNTFIDEVLFVSGMVMFRDDTLSMKVSILPIN